MLPQGLLFSKRSDGVFDYLAGSSVGVPPPQQCLGQGSFRKMPDIAAVKRDIGSSFPVLLPFSPMVKQDLLSFLPK